jgi:hypothetical protein
MTRLVAARPTVRLRDVAGSEQRSQLRTTGQRILRRQPTLLEQCGHDVDPRLQRWPHHLVALRASHSRTQLGALAHQAGREVSLARTGLAGDDDARPRPAGCPLVVAPETRQQLIPADEWSPIAQEPWQRQGAGRGDAGAQGTVEVGEQRTFDCVETGRGVEAGLLGEELAVLMTPTKRFGAAACPGQRSHQLDTHPLTQGLFHSEPVEIGDELTAGAHRKTSVEVVLRHDQAQLVEPARLRCQPRVLG